MAKSDETPTVAPVVIAESKEDAQAYLDTKFIEGDPVVVLPGAKSIKGGGGRVFVTPAMRSHPERRALTNLARSSE